MRKLRLQEWSNNYQCSVDKLKRYGNKIVNASKSGSGHIITYEHPTLTKRPAYDDMVEYYDLNGKKRKGRILATDKDQYVIKDHVNIFSEIISIGNIIRKCGE